MKFYHPDKEYIKSLKRIDYRVSDIEKDKEKRLFVGIVLDINGVNYYAPLSSPKGNDYDQNGKRIKKHYTCVYIRIKHRNDNYEELGKIYLNNMVPILESKLTLADFEIKDEMSTEEIQYIGLLRKQHRIVTSKGMINQIKQKASRMYEIKTELPRNKYYSQICNFGKLESKMKKIDKQDKEKAVL